MRISKKQTLGTIIAIILVTSMATMLIPQSNVTAEVINGVNYNKATADAINAGMTWDLNANASTTRLTLWNRYHDQIPTWVFSTISPNPLGVGQEFTMVIFNPQVPYQAQDTNNIRYKYHVVITKPDGTTETLPSSGSLTSDSTGTTYTKYTPEAIGNYSIMVVFEQLNWRFSTAGAGQDYYGVTFLSSNRTYIVNVQQEPVTSSAITYYPLPTEYWARPITGSTVRLTATLEAQTTEFRLRGLLQTVVIFCGLSQLRTVELSAETQMPFWAIEKDKSSTQDTNTKPECKTLQSSCTDVYTTKNH
jgi:hypothetical protein